MTHAEAAASWDFAREDVVKLGHGSDSTAKKLGLWHENYGPTQWDRKYNWPGSSVSVLRWDLAQLRRTDKMGSGGDELREMIRKEMGGAQSGVSGQNNSVAQSNSEPVIVKPDIVKPDIVKPDIVKPDIVKLDICDEIANEK